VEEYRKELSDDNYILIKYERNGGEIEYMLVVYYSIINEKQHQIFRVDMGHGFLHKDKLYEQKKKRVKEPIFEKPAVETVWSIVKEIQEN